MGKQETLKNYILSEIRLGRLKPGDKLYSRSVFMEKFGCARATVDQVISKLIQAHVLKSTQGSGTFVSGPLERIAGKEIAIVAPIIGHPSMPQEIIRAFLQTMGTGVGIRYFTYDDLKHPKSWEECKKQRGIVFIQPDMQQGPLLYETRSLQIPHLVLYRDIPESSFVSIDNHGAIAGLVDALHARGLQRIAYVGTRESRYHFPEQRYSGFLEGLLRNQLPLNKDHVVLVTFSGVEKYLKTLFTGPEKPDAVIAASVPLGLVMKAAEARGLVPGRDVFLAQVDPVPKDTYSFPVLSTESIIAKVGSEGARVFSRLLEQPDTIIQKLITPKIISNQEGQ